LQTVFLKHSQAFSAHETYCRGPIASRNNNIAITTSYCDVLSMYQSIVGRLEVRITARLQFVSTSTLIVYCGADNERCYSTQSSLYVMARRLIASQSVLYESSVVTMSLLSYTVVWCSVGRRRPHSSSFCRMCCAALSTEQSRSLSSHAMPTLPAANTGFIKT